MVAPCQAALLIAMLSIAVDALPLIEPFLDLYAR